MDKEDVYVHLHNGILQQSSNETMPLAATCVVFEIITLSEVTQRKTNLTVCHLHVESKL